MMDYYEGKKKAEKGGDIYYAVPPMICD